MYQLNLGVMNRYRTLQTEADNAYISPFAVGHILLEAENDPCLQPTPLNPNPPVISSYFDYKSWDDPITHNTRRAEPVKSQPPERLMDRSTLYGPSSSGHASLRYYGVGPY
jgi:hypothetical protein